MLRDPMTVFGKTLTEDENNGLAQWVTSVYDEQLELIREGQQAAYTAHHIHHIRGLQVLNKFYNLYNQFEKAGPFPSDPGLFWTEMVEMWNGYLDEQMSSWKDDAAEVIDVDDLPAVCNWGMTLYYAHEAFSRIDAILDEKNKEDR